MKANSLVIAGAFVLASVAFGSAQAEGDPQRGAAAYRACAACHSLEPGLHLTGPSLADMWEKPAASVPDFPRYSQALKEQTFLWEETSLNAWLANPQAFVPGNTMTFRGIEDKQARADLIAFLKLAMGTEGAKAVVEQGLVPPMLARGQAPDPLDDVGPSQQVTAVRYCENSFFVVTADGREHAFWALNLRLKVDSSPTGPKGDTPVLVASGMQGDRASVVFPDAAQISAFIESRC